MDAADVTGRSSTDQLLQAAALWQPFFFHAITAGCFGALTIFWQAPSVQVMSVAGGLYFIAIGAAFAWTAARLGVSRSPEQWIAGLASGSLVVVGLLNLVLHGDAMFAVTGSVALIPAGLISVYLGVRRRGSNIASKDLMIVGAVTAATGVLLPLFTSAGAHALLGVTGGGAVITAVVLALAALTYRHTLREQAADGITGA